MASQSILKTKPKQQSLVCFHLHFSNKNTFCGIIHKKKKTKEQSWQGYSSNFNSSPPCSFPLTWTSTTKLRSSPTAPPLPSSLSWARWPPLWLRRRSSRRWPASLSSPSSSMVQVGKHQKFLKWTNLNRKNPSSILHSDETVFDSDFVNKVNIERSYL